MKHLLTGATTLAKRNAPVATAAVAAALSVGAYSVYSAQAASSTRAHHGFTLTVRPRTMAIARGSAARFTFITRRQGRRGRVKLQLLSKLPRGLTASFSTTRNRPNRIVLVLRTNARLRLGQYRLRVRATRGGRRKTVTLTLTVGAQPTTAPTSGSGLGTIAGVGGESGSGTGSGGGQKPAFSISGDVAGQLGPGVTQPIDLQIHNPNSESLTITGLAASLGSVNAPQATQALPCTAGDFALQQYSGLFPIVIAPEGTATLAQLGVPAAEWPHISMNDLPSDQDGCKGASLALAYSADARLG